MRYSEVINSTFHLRTSAIQSTLDMKLSITMFRRVPENTPKFILHNDLSHFLDKLALHSPTLLTVFKHYRIP